jgi:transcriptional regulator with XRE-family HTH domain
MKIEDSMPEATILEELGRRLARVRKQQGLTQTNFASDAGIGVATLRRIEAGKDSQMETWLKVMRTLSMISTVDAFLPENFDSPMAEARDKSKRTRKSDPHTKKKWGDERK